MVEYRPNRPLRLFWWLPQNSRLVHQKYDCYDIGKFRPASTIVGSGFRTTYLAQPSRLPVRPAHVHRLQVRE